MSPEITRFLALHARFAEITWQWIFRGTQLRASAGRHTATISAAVLAGLVDAGLIESVGIAGVRLTPAGIAQGTV